MLNFTIFHIFIIYSSVIVWSSNGVSGDCAEGFTETFERVTGQIPQTQAENLLLAREPGALPLATECARRCLNDTIPCQSFVVDYFQNACFRVSVASSDELFGFHPSDFFQASSVVFFSRICIKAPACGELAWMIERAPGFELRTSHTLTISNVTNRVSCAALCVNENRFSCRSAQYEGVLKRCRLSSEDRRTLPHAFVPALGDTEYLENQCTQFYHKSSQVCSFEEFRDSTLNLTDVALPGLSFKQCKQLCEAERRFRCRGFTFAVQSNEIIFAQAARCLLHSADIASAGPGALIALPGALYSERAPCLDLVMRCSKAALSIKLRTPDPFYGRIFVRGHANICDVAGKGKNETVLSVGPRCAAFSDGGVNVAVVVQYNAILQRRGDRALNVTCVYGDSLLAAVNGSIQVDGDPFLGGSVAVNSSDEASAAVRIEITDQQGREASITEVGRDLELRVVAVNTDPFDIAAGQLIASNVEGTESVLLLDERGCPPDPATFPALQKVPGSRDLVARFRAFRFTTSTVVRFHVRVHFCLQTCPPVNCGGVVGESYGRRRRDDKDVTARGADVSSSSDAGEAAAGRALAWPASDPVESSSKGFPGELPLEMDIFVLPDTRNVIKIRSNNSATANLEDQPIVFDVSEEDYRGSSTPPHPAGSSIGESTWCVSEGVFIGVLVAWVVLQLLMAAAVWTAARTFLAKRPPPVKLRNVKWQGSIEAFS